jgi:hypothetical protein
MKVNILKVKDRELDSLLERVKQRAESLGMPPEEAYREALRAWLQHFSEPAPEPEGAVLEATDQELAALKLVLSAMRTYDR